MKNPFIAGSWVRGENFFGRKKLIDEILRGGRNYLWIAATRRFGKTSLLKQIEWLTTEGAYANEFVSLFWDLQGSRDIAGLKETLLESVEDASERFADIGVHVDDLEGRDIFESLRILKRSARAKNLNLLLLCDEAEELINVEKNNPEVLPKLRRIFQRGENLVTVLTATKRLGALENSSNPQTSPFLYGFVPPVYLSRLEDKEAKRLIGLGHFAPAVVAEILAKTNNHPYLLQLICRRLFECHDLPRVIEEVSHDDMIAHFFAVDFQILRAEEKEILLHLLQNQLLTLPDLQNKIGESQENLIEKLYGLLQSGIIKQEESHYRISNYFFEQWLQREKDKLYSETSLRRAQASESIASAPRKMRPMPEIGDRLGQHHILEKLGAGGMGVVFKALDEQLQRIVALKVLRADLMANSDFKERFVLEARAASALNHPNIATIYQIGEAGGLLFISMEYVAGQTLRGWFSNQPASLLEKLNIAIQVASGLTHAHARNIVHRDIKPENIMITRDAQAKIMDFGLAKMQQRPDKGLTKTGTTLGTLSYMSPEQASGLPTDHRTDIFSFGVLLYELLAGQRPFNGEHELTVLYSIINEEPEPLRAVNADLPELLEWIVQKTLEKDRDERCDDAATLLSELQEVKAGLPTSPV